MKKTICMLLMILFLSMAADTMAGGMWASTSRVIELKKNEEWINAETSAETIPVHSSVEDSKSRRVTIVSDPIRIELPFHPSPTTSDEEDHTTSSDDGNITTPGGEVEDEAVDEPEDVNTGDNNE